MNTVFFFLKQMQLLYYPQGCHGSALKAHLHGKLLIWIASLSASWENSQNIEICLNYHLYEVEGSTINKCSPADLPLK